jgi:hypothetical protein
MVRGIPFAKEIDGSRCLTGANRKKLAQSEPKLVTSLVMLMDSPSLKVQCQAALALRNLASDGRSP